MCPHCGSDNVLIHSDPYDFGMDPETGYVDAGYRESYICQQCGMKGDDVEGDLDLEGVIRG
jgi:hypothetical protein